MGGLGDAAGAADVNTIVPVSEVATGLRRPLGPGGFMELSQAELSQAAGVNHVSACGFTSGLPVATGRKCLHRPVTSERALRAVNSGLQRGRGHSRSGAVAASLSCFSCSVVWELAAAWVSGPDKLIRRGPGVGVLRNASALCWTPCERGCERGAVSVGCVQRGFSTSACTWAPVVTGRSGRQPLRIRGLTAGREFQAWLSRESLHWGDGRTGCLVLPPWHGRVVLPPEPRIWPAGVWEWFPWLRAKPKRLEAWNTSRREARHFCQRGCHAAAALSRSPARARATSSLRGISPRSRAALAAFR